MRRFKRVIAAFLATVVCVTIGFAHSYGNSVREVYAASSMEYPVQKFRIVIGNSDRNINISGFGDSSPLNSWITNGEENEKWYLEYQSEGVYKIINSRTDKAITADNGICTIDTINNESNQLWKIIGTETDFNGDYLYYKIVSYDDENMAMTFKPKGNKVVLEQYNQGEYQKFKINCDGLEGFAGNCQVTEGEKAATIGGLFGETIFVDTLDELKNALVEEDPLTIVLTADIDCSGENYDWRIEDNKTLIGSYANNQLMDCKLRTNDYFEEEDPSDNIIVRNIRFQIEKNKEMMAFAIYSSQNIWIDHCDFNCEFTKEYAEVGKFIWINTPFSGKDVGRSPDFMTFSYNTFSNRYWGIAFGTQNGEIDKDRATMIYNIFDSIVQRAPQIGNGTLHVMNNYYVRNTTSIDDAGMEQIKCGADSKIYSVANRFEGFKKESSGYWDKEMTVYPDSVITDVDSYTDKTENGGGTPYKITISTDHIENTEKPETFYGYEVLSAYDANGTNDVKAFCQLYSGCVESGNPVYITDSSVSGYVTGRYTSPFVKNLEVTQEEPTTESATEVTTEEPTTESTTEVTTEEPTTESTTEVITEEPTTESTMEVTTEEPTTESTTEATTKEPTTESTTEGTTEEPTTESTTEVTTEEPTSEGVTEVTTEKPVVESTTEMITEETISTEESTAESTTEQLYNYGTALQKSLIFYELQKSGKLDGEEFNRNNWRGDSCLNDGQDVGLDLTGGWFDAGDTMKFNLPMSYTATTLAWSYLENTQAYEKAGQTKYILNSIQWANDYFIKCHPEENVYYYQVGNVESDHDYWGAAETVETRMERPSYKVDNTSAKGGSTVCGETAASLAACSIVFKDIDVGYSEQCLKHAKEILTMAEDAMSDNGYTAAKDCYDSWSGFYDELSWANLWIYRATGEEQYLKKAEQYTDYWGTMDSSDEFEYEEGQCWDDVHYGAALMIAQYDPDSEIGKKCKRNIENNLDWWKNGATQMSPMGQAWLTEWSSLAYSTTSAFVAMMYVQWDGADPDRVEAYEKFAKSQADYALGSSGQCFQVGYQDEESPRNVHHATAHGTWTGELEEPERSRHLLVGALVGGPRAADDKYTDDRSDYYSNEVACDYNAGFTGLMAALYDKYGQEEEIAPDAGAYEEVDDIEELSIEAGIAQQNPDSNYISVKAVIYNKTAWPARVTDKLTYRYYVDISDVLENGGSLSDISVDTDYNTSNATASALKPWDAENGIYYTEIDLSGIDIYPGGEDCYNNEMYFRITAKDSWDYTKSPSYKGLESATAENMVKAENMALYDNGILVFGSEPERENVTTEEVTTESETTQTLTTENQTTERVTAEDITTQESTTEKQTTERVTTQESTTEKQTTEQVATQNPTTEKQTTERVTTQSPTTEKQTTERVTTQNPTTEKQTTAEVTTQIPTTEKMTTEGTTTEDITNEQISVIPAAVVMNVGDSKTLTVQIYPNNADNQNVTWSSSNDKVVTVDQNGRITAVAEGKATVIVVTADGGKIAFANVVVYKKAVVNPTIKVESIQAPAAVTLKKNKSKNLAVQVLPTNATNRKVTFATVDCKVATVDANGKVTAVAPGVTTITISAENNIKTAVTVKVLPDKVTSLKKRTVNGKIRLTWKKQKGITGYKVYRYNSKTKKYKLYKTTKKNYVTISKGKKNALYKFKVKAYKKSKSGIVYGSASKVLKVAIK